jgi:uncharacterized RDD family membrane protein YckC
MKTRLLLTLTLLTGGGLLHAQEAEFPRREFSNPSVRILQSFTLRAGETAEQIVVVGGDATIEGHVTENVVVVLGRAQLGSTAEIDGQFVVVGGSAVVTQGAKVHGDVVAIGGIDAPPDFSPDGTHLAIGTTSLGSRLTALVPWITRGLVFGRLIVPDLGWVWTVALVFFFLNLVVNLLFDGPVSACASALRTTPVSGFLTGLLVLLLAGPLCLLLAVSVVGIAVIPFVCAALLLAAVFGRVGFARWLGMSVLHQEDLENRAHSLRSFLIGSALMCVAYMIPVIGLLTWALAGVFGLGSATQAFMRAYRRENPKAPRKAPPVVPVAPAPATAVAAPQVSVEAPSASPFEESFEPIPDPLAPAAATATASATSLLACPRATFFERLAAFALDVVLLLIAAQILRLDRLFEGYPSMERNLVLLAVVYHVGFWVWKQTTVGGLICQLRLVRTDGNPVTFAEALVRGLTGIFSLAVVGLGFFWILRDPERQAWHDRVAGTYVVKVPRNWPF